MNESWYWSLGTWRGWILRAASNCTVSDVKASPQTCSRGSSGSGSTNSTQPIDCPAPG